MSTVQQLLQQLTALVEKTPEAAGMQVVGSHGSSGVMYEIGSASLNLNDEPDYDQPGDYGVDVESGDPYVRVYLGN